MYSQRNQNQNKCPKNSDLSLACVHTDRPRVESDGALEPAHARRRELLLPKVVLNALRHDTTPHRWYERIDDLETHTTHVLVVRFPSARRAAAIEGRHLSWGRGGGIATLRVHHDAGRRASRRWTTCIATLDERNAPMSAGSPQMPHSSSSQPDAFMAGCGFTRTPHPSPFRPIRGEHTSHEIS